MGASLGSRGAQAARQTQTQAVMTRRHEWLNDEKMHARLRGDGDEAFRKPSIQSPRAGHMARARDECLSLSVEREHGTRQTADSLCLDRVR